MANIFDIYTLPLADWIQSAVRWFAMEFRPFFQTLKIPVDEMLRFIVRVLQGTPPLVFLVVLFILAWRIAGIKVGIFSLLTMLIIGFLGIWSEAMTTLSMVITAVLFCAIIGFPIGILAARSNLAESIIRPVLDAMQTTPAFVYLVPIVMLFGVGTVPGVIATVIFAMPPFIRLTNLGIRQVPGTVIEAAYAFGSTERQVLWKIQIPLAMRTIMTGLNQTLMLSLSMVVIAALIAAGGLGAVVFRGIGRLDVGLAAVGGIGIILLAIMLDRITQALSKPGQVMDTQGGVLHRFMGSFLYRKIKFEGHNKIASEPASDALIVDAGQDESTSQ